MASNGLWRCAAYSPAFVTLDSLISDLPISFAEDDMDVFEELAASDFIERHILQKDGWTYLGVRPRQRSNRDTCKTSPCAKAFSAQVIDCQWGMVVQKCLVYCGG